MRKILFFLLAFPGISQALAPIVAGPQVWGLDHDTLTVTYLSTQTSHTLYGIDTVSHSSYSALSGNYSRHSTTQYYTGLNVTTHEYYDSGLLPGTTYYSRACTSDGTEYCSAEFSFVTLSTPTPHPSVANLPVLNVDTTTPTCGNGLLHCSSGNPVTVTVGADCDDPTTGLLALWTAATWGDTIIIPTTTICSGHYVFPYRTPDTNNPQRWIVVQSANVSNLTPGKRVSISDAANMPVVQQTAWGVLTSTTQGTIVNNNYCYPGGYNWSILNAATPGWNMFYCGVVQKVSISSISYAGYDGGYGASQYSLVLSTSFATLPYSSQFCMADGIKISKANGTCWATPGMTSSTMTIDMTNGYGQVGGPLASGTDYPSTGTLTFYDYSQPSYVSYSGSSPTVACMPGQWAYSNQQPDGSALTRNYPYGYEGQTTGSMGRVWLCDATSTWVRWIPITGGSYAQQASFVDAATLELSNASYTRFVGLNFEATQLTYDPNWKNVGTPNSVTSGVDTLPFVNMGPYTNHIIFDRCIFKATYPAKVGVMFEMNGDYIGITNSYLYDDAGDWVSPNNRGAWTDNNATDKISGYVGGPKLIQNNYLEGYGITIHFNDQNTGTNDVTHDVSVLNNYFYRDLSKIYGTSTYNKSYYMALRQLLEFKRGYRIDVEGNVFNGNFRNTAQGAAMNLSETPMNGGGNGMYCLLTVSGSTATCAGYVGANPGIGDLLEPSDGTPLLPAVTSLSVFPSSFSLTMYPSTPAWSSGYAYFRDVTPSLEGIYDVTVKNNIFEALPTLIIYVPRWQSEYFSIPLHRATFQNNLVINWGVGSNGGLGLPPEDEWQGGGAGGYNQSLCYGLTDNVVDHNTFYGFASPTTTDVAYQSQIAPFTLYGDPFPVNEGLQFTNNLLWANSNVELVENLSGGLRADTALDTYYGGTLPYAVNNNAFVRVGGLASGYQSPNDWQIYTSTTPFANPNLNNFKLVGQFRSSDTCYSVPGDCTTDGADEGVNIGQLITAQGSNYPFTIQGTPGTIFGSGTIIGGGTIHQ